jgi:hypothetical protein
MKAPNDEKVCEAAYCGGVELANTLEDVCEAARRGGAANTAEFSSVLIEPRHKITTKSISYFCFINLFHALNTV